MNKEEITIPLNKVSYEDLEALTIEQQTQLFVKDKEIERLKDLIKSLFYRDYKHELNEEQLELLDNIVFGSIDKENE